MAEPTDPFDLLREHLDRQFIAVNQRIDDRVGEVSRNVQSISYVLNGNGSPGLIRLVDRHEQRFASMDTNTRQMASRHGGVWGGIAGVLSTVVLMVLGYFGIRPQ